MQKKRMLAGMLAGAVTLSSLSLSAMAVDFLDTQGHWGSSSVSRWADYGVVNGSDGKFNPDASMTRAEMATILVNLLDLQEKGSNTFSDVQAGAWYEDAILKCAAAGIMKGDGNGANPNGKISREEAAVMLGRALGIEPATGGVLFGDGAQVADWAAGYVKALSDRGIINGVGDNQFAPQVDISRASVTTILDKSISTYANKDGETITASGAGIVLVTAKNVTVTGEVKGGLLVSPAVSGSALTVDNAKISGGVTVQGSANIALTGTTTVDKVSLDAQGAKLTTSKDTTVQTISATAPQTEVTVGGKANTIDVAEGATGAAVNVSEGATVQSVTAAASGTNLSVAGTVSSVTVADTASGSTVTAEKTGAITSVNTSAAGTTVKGEGKVESVTTTNKSDTTVSTPGTTTTEVKPTTPDTPSTPGTTTGGGSTSGGGGGGGGGGGSTGGGGGGGGSDSGDTDDKVTTESRDVIAAGLFDQSGEIKENLAKDYSVSAVKYSNVTHTNVTVKATDLQFHKASDDAGFGYWVGVGIPRADKDKAATVVQGWGSVPATTTAEYKAPDANAEANGKTYDTVYFNVGSTENTNKKGYLFVKSVEGEGESAKETIARYEIDFSGVTLSTTAAEFSTEFGKLPAGANAKYLSRTEDAQGMVTIEMELTGSVAHGLDNPYNETDVGLLGYAVINAALVAEGQSSTYATISMVRGAEGRMVQTNNALKPYLIDGANKEDIKLVGGKYVKDTKNVEAANQPIDYRFAIIPGEDVTITGSRTYVLKNNLKVSEAPAAYTAEADITIAEGQSIVIKAGKTITIPKDKKVILEGTGETAGKLTGVNGAKLVIAGAVTGMEAGSYTWTDGAWKADAATPDPDEPIGDPVDVIAAGLFDQSGEITGELATDYTVEATKVAANDYVDVVVKATNLQFHKASDGAGFGYWVGVGIPRKDKATAAKVVQGWGEVPTTVPTDFNPFDSEMESDDKTKTYDTVYFNVGSANNEGTGYLFVKNGEGETATIEKYQIDFSGVETLAKTKEFSGEKSFLPAGATAEYVSRTKAEGETMETITIKLTGAVAHGLDVDGNPILLDYPVINAALIGEGQSATYGIISMNRGEGGQMVQTNPALKYYLIDGANSATISKKEDGTYVKDSKPESGTTGAAVNYGFSMLPETDITIVGNKKYVIDNQLTIKTDSAVPSEYTTVAGKNITIAAGQSIVIGEGKTITMADGSSLTIADTGSLTGAGTLIIEEGATVTGVAGITESAAGAYTYKTDKWVLDSTATLEAARKAFEDKLALPDGITAAVTAEADDKGVITYKVVLSGATTEVGPKGLNFDDAFSYLSFKPEGTGEGKAGNYSSLNLQGFIPKDANNYTIVQQNNAMSVYQEAKLDESGITNADGTYTKNKGGYSAAEGKAVDYEMLLKSGQNIEVTMKNGETVICKVTVTVPADSINGNSWTGVTANATALKVTDEEPDTDNENDTFTLTKQDNTAFPLDFTHIKRIGREKAGELTIYDLVLHPADNNNCSAEVEGAVGKLCMVENAEGHDAGLTLKNGAEARTETYYFQEKTSNVWYKAEVTIPAKEEAPAENGTPAEEEQPSAEGENTDTTTPDGGSGDANTDTPAEGGNTDAPAEGENTNPPVEGENTDSGSAAAPTDNAQA